ncbi:hypothetical protein VPH35_120669 [Triticum aestivum]
MSKRRKSTYGASPTSTTLTDDILVEIFTRLPAKSVGRLRCLSRSWAATLTSASFVDLHLLQSNSHHVMPRLFFTTGHLEDPDNTWPIEVLTKPCNGLVLLHRLPHHGYYICNPSTGALLPLPDSQQRRVVSYGLGYSRATMEHKVVRLFYSYHSTPCCQVFTLDVSAHWRVAAQRPPPTCAVVGDPAVFCHGHLHFLDKQSGSIVTLDVGDETFSSLTMPQSANDNTGPLELTVLDGCLCLCVFHDRPPCRDVDPYCIWRLACREAGKWEKLYRVMQPQTSRPELDLLRVHWVSPLGINRAGNIMFATEEGVLKFDVQGGGVPEMLVSPTEITNDSFCNATISSRTVGLVEESLVSVGRTSEEIIFSSPWRKAWSDVLKWLPVQSIVPLKCVCKEWHAVIKSDRFIQIHALHTNLGKGPQIRLVQPFSFSEVFYPLEYCERVQHEMMPFLFDPRISRTVCSKPCHGLVLVSYIYERSCIDFICNPSREYCSKPVFLDHHIHDAAGSSSLSAGRIGLGYDLRTNQHVLARLVCGENTSRGNYQLECYVKSINTKSSWVSITPPPRPVVDMQPAYAHGKLYWIVDDDELGTKPGSRCELLALDVGTTEFQVLRAPPCNRDQITSIVEFRGNICILCSDRRANAIVVWTLDGGSWSRGPYRIELGEFRQMYPSEATTLLDVDPKEGRVLLSTGRALGYYDPKTRELQTLYYLGEHLQDMMFAPALCRENLIRPRT